jgi:hypothetical protein
MNGQKKAKRKSITLTFRPFLAIFSIFHERAKRSKNASL